MLLFIQARPTPRFSGLAHARPCLSLLTPSPSDSWGPRISRVGRDVAHRSKPGPTPPPRHVTSPLPAPLPLSDVPCRPLKRSHRPPIDFLLPRALHMHPSPPRRPPRRLSATRAPPPCRTPSEHHRRPPPSGERPSSYSFPQSTTACSPHWSRSSCRTLHTRRRPLELPSCR
jgi:hypothetical protein